MEADPTMKEASIMCIDYTGLPEHMVDPMRRYIEVKMQPGGFLTSVLANDLMVACATADFTNRGRLFDIVQWLYNEAPSDCWGSPEKVKAWLSLRTYANNAEL